MNQELRKNYRQARENGWFYETKRGLIKVWGKESAQFLNGLITGDAAKLEENSEMLAAFPNAQGRLLALVRVMKKDGAFLFETEDTMREKVYQNLFRFTFAGDFYVEDLTEKYSSFEIQNSEFEIQDSESLEFNFRLGRVIYVPNDSAENLTAELKNQNAVEISAEVHEIFRIENGVPKYAVEMDETTIVPELGIDGLINYNKGCYIGQEIIARIHFRGHVAKKLTGVILSEPSASADGSISDTFDFTEFANAELKSPDGKSAGRVTSATFSPKLNKIIALAYVRYDYLASGTQLKLNDATVQVTDLPFV